MKHALDDYAAAYEASYGKPGSVADFSPYMLQAFVMLADRLKRHELDREPPPAEVGGTPSFRQ